MLERSVLLSAASGALLGVAWILFGPIGWVLSGVLVPIAVMVLVIAVRWTEIGALLLLNGVIPLPVLLLADAGDGPLIPVVSRGLQIGMVVAGPQAALAAAVILTVAGGAVLAVVAIGARRQRARVERRAARRQRA